MLRREFVGWLGSLSCVKWLFGERNRKSIVVCEEDRLRDWRGLVWEETDEVVVFCMDRIDRDGDYCDLTAAVKRWPDRAWYKHTAGSERSWSFPVLVGFDESVAMKDRSTFLHGLECFRLGNFSQWINHLRGLRYLMLGSTISALSYLIR